MDLAGIESQVSLLPGVTVSFILYPIMTVIQEVVGGLHLRMVADMGSDCDADLCFIHRAGDFIFGLLPERQESVFVY